MADPAQGPVTDEGVAFELDGRPATARPGEMLISAAERAGVFIPRFCYHPRMKSVGVCRMCLVEVEGPRGATLQPSCFIEVNEGMKVDTRSDKVKKAQDGVLEFLLVNHPLDCPVCDKGGECPLQDQTLAYGPGESRFVEEKRHFEKPIPVSDLVLLDRERCIQCSRCTRFAAEVAGEAQIDFAGRGEMVEVATFPDIEFTSYFSGNTVQICPVGALTATPYRFTARPWDLDQVESTCTTCALGCRVAVQSSANRLTRLLGIDSDPVNHGWLCDKGRFVFEAVNGDVTPASGQPGTPPPGDPLGGDVKAEVPPGSFAGEVRETGRAADDRLTEPTVRKEGQLVEVSWAEALSRVADALVGLVEEDGPESVAVLGGGRLTNEDAYAWAKFAKGVLGTDSVDAQLGDGLPAELVLALPRATIDEACRARTVVLLTGDVREELPVLFLRLRDAVTEGHTSLVELAQAPTSLSPLAAVSLALRPGDAPEVARALTGDAAAESALRSHPAGPTWSAEELGTARRLVAEAGAGGRPGDGVVVIVGRPSLAEHAEVTAAAARTLAAAWPGARFLSGLRRGNVHGALDMGMAPGLLPGRVSLEGARSWFAPAWPSLPSIRGRDAAGILTSAAGMGGATDTADRPGPAPRVRGLVLVGADPLSDFPDHEMARRALSEAELVVLVSSHPSAVLEHADVVLPASTAHERLGTTTNIEGRVSRVSQKLVPPGLVWPDWMIASELSMAMGQDLGVASATELWEEIEHLAPAHRGLTPEVLESPALQDGVVVPLTGHGDHGEGAVGPPPTPIDPVALPGIEAVERQGAPPRVGLAERPGIEDLVELSERANGPDRPEPLSDPGAPEGPGPHVAPADSYSLQLVSVRRLYDGGSAVAGSPSVLPLVPFATVRANPYDLDRLGAATGDAVRVRSPRGSLQLPAEHDPGIPRGVVAIDFNLPAAGGGPTNAAATLIDAGAAVNEVRLETV